ncbi:MAG TPA: hypothetical protein VGV93_08950 [Acidimicrobiales bacterium]|nr:hypothetical protein [Acidimicrobiales bacterium]
MNTPVSFHDLDQMAAEVLPERTVLSVIVTPAGGGGGISDGGGGGGTVVMSACTTSNTYTNPGVLGVLAPQVQQGPIQTMSCTPAAIATS